MGFLFDFAFKRFQSTVLGISLFITFSTTVEAGPIFFSVDQSTEELVSIDAATGNVSVIGSLGIDALDLDLAMVNGRLFGLNSEFQVRVDLLEINPSTGAVISSTQVKLGSTGIVSAEGLGNVGGQLKIGFTNGSPDPAISESIGDLALDGSISNNLNLGNNLVDFDGLSAASGNILYFVDAFLPTSSTRTTFFSLDLSGPTITQFAHVPLSTHRGNDVVAIGNSLYSISSSNILLKEIDISTGNLVGDITLSRSGNYRGLAAAVVVPEPSSIVLLITGAIGLFGYGYRRKRKHAA